MKNQNAIKYIITNSLRQAVSPIVKINQILEQFSLIPYGPLPLKRGEIFYVGGDRWVFYWVTQYISNAVRAQGVPVHTITYPWKLRNQIIHFGNRDQFFNGSYKKIDRSNRIILTWFHGDRNDQNPDMQNLFKKLADVDNHIDRYLVSCKISQKVIKSEGIPDKKITLIPLGVDLSVFKPASVYQKNQIRKKIGIPDGVFCIGYFQKDGVGWGDGREPKLVKGPDIFLRVIEKVFSDYKNLFILLTGPARGYVKNGLDQLGIPYIHHYLPHYPDIVTYYQACDLTLITSQAEGGPNAFVESWATGVPVVSTRVGMPADYIQQNENGLIADVGDVETLSYHVLTMITNQELREHCIAHALSEVCMLDWRIIGEHYYNELYKPCLDEIRV